MTQKMLRAKLESELRMRSFKDPEFRKALIADPKKTMQKVSSELGMDPQILDHFKHIHIHQEKPGELCVGIPASSATTPLKESHSPTLGTCNFETCSPDYTSFCSESI